MENLKQKFIRTYQIIIGESGGKGVEILPPFNIEFDIQKTKDKEPNRNLIRIYNLADATIERISKQDLSVVLYAGYERDGGALLMASGSITFVQTFIQGADLITEIEFLDGFVKLRDSVISVSFQAGISTKIMLEEIAKKMGLHLIMSDKLEFKSFKTSYTFYGASRIALDKICSENGFEWSVQNGDLQIVLRGGKTPRKAFVIKADTGMIESPRRIKETAEDKREDKKSYIDKSTKKSQHQILNGLEVSTLLVPTVQPADLIKLESRQIKGWFRVEEITHSGAFMGGDWISMMKISEIEVKEDEQTRR